jgi:hypothetical protein
MNTQQAYIEGFVKRASQYGFSYNEAISLLKQAALTGDQHKLDINHDGKIGASDLKALRNRKKTPEIAKQADEYVATEPTFAQKAAIKPKPIAPAKPMPTRPVPPKPKVPNYPGEADANDVAGYR